MTSNMTPYLGGWCQRRELCQHYHSDAKAEPSESLCTRTGDNWFIAVDPQPKEAAK